jgi:hypothetical protein
MMLERIKNDIWNLIRKKNIDLHFANHAPAASW